MGDEYTGGYTGGGYNWWDTDQYYTDPADPAGGGGGDDTTDAGTDADTVTVDQAIEDLFEDPDFIAALTEIMEDQNFSLGSLNEEYSAWSGANWDTYFDEFFSGQFDPDWWSQYLEQHLGEEDEETDDPYEDVGQAPYGTANDGTPLPDPTDYEEGETIDFGEGGIYRCDFGEGGEKIWTKVGEGGEGGEDGVYGGGESEDLDGAPLPDPGDHEEGIRIQRGGVIYVIKDGVWHEAKEGDDDEEEDGAGDKGGLFGLGIGPWLKDLFGLSDTGLGDFLSGIFGSSGGIKSLMELMAAYAKMKGSYDQYRYKVPITQSDAMSEYEKAHPLDIDMGLEGLGPNYLEDQLYGIPISAKNVPVPTHKLGFPYAEEIEEEVQVGQRGGIMNARSHGDIVPALLEPGEFVMNLQSVKGAGNGDARQGAKNMYKMMRQLERMGQ